MTKESEKAANEAMEIIDIYRDMAMFKAGE